MTDVGRKAGRRRGKTSWNDHRHSLLGSCVGEWMGEMDLSEARWLHLCFFAMPSFLLDLHHWNKCHPPTHCLNPSQSRKSDFWIASIPGRRPAFLHFFISSDGAPLTGLGIPHALYDARLPCALYGGGGGVGGVRYPSIKAAIHSTSRTSLHTMNRRPQPSGQLMTKPPNSSGRSHTRSTLDVAFDLGAQYGQQGLLFFI